MVILKPRFLMLCGFLVSVLAGNPASCQECDFDGDGDCDVADIDLFWQQTVPKAIVAVPEPTGYLLGLLVATGLVQIVRRRPAAFLMVMISLSWWR